MKRRLEGNRQVRLPEQVSQRAAHHHVFQLRRTERRARAALSDLTIGIIGSRGELERCRHGVYRAGNALGQFTRHLTYNTAESEINSQLLQRKLLKQS